MTDKDFKHLVGMYKIAKRHSYEDPLEVEASVPTVTRIMLDGTPAISVNGT